MSAFARACFAPLCLYGNARRSASHRCLYSGHAKEYKKTAWKSDDAAPDRSTDALQVCWVSLAAFGRTASGSPSPLHLLPPYRPTSPTSAWTHCCPASRPAFSPTCRKTCARFSPSSLPCTTHPFARARRLCGSPHCAQLRAAGQRSGPARPRPGPQVHVSPYYSNPKPAT